MKRITASLIFCMICGYSSNLYTTAPGRNLLPVSTSDTAARHQSNTIPMILAGANLLRQTCSFAYIVSQWGQGDIPASGLMTHTLSLELLFDAASWGTLAYTHRHTIAQWYHDFMDS